MIMLECLYYEEKSSLALADSKIRGAGYETGIPTKVKRD